MKRFLPRREIIYRGKTKPVKRLLLRLTKDFKVKKFKLTGSLTIRYRNELVYVELGDTLSENRGRLSLSNSYFLQSFNDNY